MTAPKPAAPFQRPPSQPDLPRLEQVGLRGLDGKNQGLQPRQQAPEHGATQHDACHQLADDRRLAQAGCEGSEETCGQQQAGDLYDHQQDVVLAEGLDLDLRPGGIKRLHLVDARAQQLRQMAAVRADVRDQHQRRRDAGRQVRDEAHQRVHAAHRCAHDDDAAVHSTACAGAGCWAGGS